MGFMIKINEMFQTGAQENLFYVCFKSNMMKKQNEPVIRLVEHFSFNQMLYKGLWRG